MRLSHNPGRIAGLWYLLIVLIGPLRLIYIPTRLFVQNDAAATVNNIAAHEFLFRAGIASDLVGAVGLVMLTLAFYRLFAALDRDLAVMVVIFGGIMPALLYFVGVVADYGTLIIIGKASFLSAFDAPQQDALAMLLVKLRDRLNTGAEILWGVWLFPLALLTYRSRFLPRFLGVWLALAGIGWLALSFTSTLWPQYQGTVYTISQPLTIGEMVYMLWLVIKGAKPSSVDRGVSEGKAQ